MTLPALSEDVVRDAPDTADSEGFGALKTDLGCLPLVGMSFTTKVTGLTAQIVVRQTFRNALDVPVETTYIFPLPGRAAVTGFEATLGGRVVKGRLDERGAARTTYDTAVAAGQRAAIMEEERPEIFTTRVGNLQPGEEAVIELTLASQLPYEDGEVTLRLPLVVAPRYVPGTPLDGASVGTGTSPDTDQVPDASRITPPVLLAGMPNPVVLTVTTSIDPAGLRVSDLRCSLHALVEGPTLAGAITEPITVELVPGAALDRDFILRWSVAAEDITTAFTCTPDAEGDEGSFVATVVPPVKGTAHPKDVVVLVDVSGSMAQPGEEWKLPVARRGAARAVDNLGPDDRIAVIAFESRYTHPDDTNTSGGIFSHRTGPSAPVQLKPATDRNRYRAVEFLARQEARGGTEAEPAIRAALESLGAPTEGRDRFLVFVTDGQIANEDRVLAAVNPYTGNTRIFTIGIGSAINAGALQRLAAAGGGRCELVESEDRLDQVMTAILRRIATPILRDVSITANGFEIVAESLSPAGAADAFEGAPLVVRGRYRGKAQGSVALAGTNRAGRTVKLSAEVGVSDNAALAPVWARANLRDLEDRYASYPHSADRKTLAERIVATSLRFGVLCRFTAFVAVDEESKVPVATHKLAQPVSPVGGSTRMALNSASVAGGFQSKGIDGGGYTFGGGFEVARSFDAGPLMGRGTRDGGERRMMSADGDEGYFGFAPPAVAPSIPPALLGRTPGLVGYQVQAMDLISRMQATLATEGVATSNFTVLVAELADMVDDMASVGLGATPLGNALVTLLGQLKATADPVAATSALGVATARMAVTTAPGAAPAPATAPAASTAPRRDDSFWK